MSIKPDIELLLEDVPYLKILNEAFNQSGKEILREHFFLKFKDVDKWTVFSDYYFEDERKSFVISMTFLPYILDLSLAKKILKKLLPKEIKHTKTISKESFEILREFPMYTISVIIPKEKYFSFGSNDNFIKAVKKSCYNLLNKEIPLWKKNRPQSINYHTLLEKKIKALIVELDRNKKGPILWQMILTSMYLGYFIAVLVDEINVQKIGWFSDRDKINDICDHISSDLIAINSIGLAKNEDFEFIYGNASCIANPWFDELIRVSDYICGALSDLDPKDSSFSTEKMEEIIKYFGIENNKNLLVYRYKKNKEEQIYCSRVIFQNSKSN